MQFENDGQVFESPALDEVSKATNELLKNCMVTEKEGFLADLLKSMANWRLQLHKAIYQFILNILLDESLSSCCLDGLI